MRSERVRHWGEQRSWGSRDVHRLQDQASTTREAWCTVSVCVCELCVYESWADGLNLTYNISCTHNMHGTESDVRRRSVKRKASEW